MLDNVLGMIDGPLWSRFKLTIIASLLLALLGLALYYPRTNLLVEGAIFDLMLNARSEGQSEIMEDIVIIAIDDASISNPRQSQPMYFVPQVWSTILDALVLSGAKVVAIHQRLPIMESRDFSLEDEAKWFRSVQTAHKSGMPVVFGFRYLSDRALLPSPKYVEIMGREHMGFLNLIHDRDNKIRLQALTWPDSLDILGPVHPKSFSLVVAKSVRPELEELPGKDFYINYSQSFTHFSFSDIYQRALNGEVGFFKRVFANKIVFIGDASSINVDAYPTPGSTYSGAVQTGWSLVPAVEIQAHSAATLLSGRLIQEPGWPLLALLYFGLVFTALTPVIINIRGGTKHVVFWIPTAVTLAYLAFCWLAFRRDVYVPVFPGLAILASAHFLYYLLRARENKIIQNTSNQALSLYLNRDLAGQIIQHPEILERRGEVRNVTVFFADLVGFTSMSETMDTADLVDILNRYYDTMNTAIERYGGFVDKFVGDAIMAVWGAPSSQPQHAVSACLSALMQKRLMEELNRELTAAGQPFLQALMGLNTGQVIAGNIGARQRINYTVMGDAVNLASRLVSVNKIFMTTILASEATVGMARDEIAFRALDRIKVKGRKSGITIYEILAHKSDLSPNMAQCVNFYERALKHYFGRDFSGALARLEAALKCQPNDNPSLIFAQRCMDYISRPPNDDWDGVTVLEAK
ncbi:MAG: adenylate/guanylate cyclase domain-containing protein [Deltaproteobacteria bacterium]|jgi:class 3 adenylate cyclase/CHASE2 domain-containing sensor protein|nr:adenylate/guanylate cyclase domain-containing protein [Deltaproteobacteria bacterium]